MDQELEKALLAEAHAREAQEEAEELVLICARDIVNAWPQMTMRKLGEMTKRVDTLRQALEAAKK